MFQWWQANKDYLSLTERTAYVICDVCCHNWIFKSEVLQIVVKKKCCSSSLSDLQCNQEMGSYSKRFKSQI